MVYVLFMIGGMVLSCEQYESMEAAQVEIDKSVGADVKILTDPNHPSIVKFIENLESQGPLVY